MFSLTSSMTRSDSVTGLREQAESKVGRIAGFPWLRNCTRLGETGFFGQDHPEALTYLTVNLTAWRVGVCASYDVPAKARNHLASLDRLDGLTTNDSASLHIDYRKVQPVQAGRAIVNVMRRRAGAC